MRAYMSFTDNHSSVPVIPPCDFDATFARAVASAGPIPDFRYGATTGAGFRHRRFAGLANFLTGLRYRLPDLPAFAWRAYVVFCVITITTVLIICLGIVIATSTHSQPPPHFSPARPVTHSVRHTALSVDRQVQVSGKPLLFRTER